jgi:FtsZ-interacting cell division protein YlmF
MRSKQTINVAIHRQRYTAKGYVCKPKKYEDLANILQHLKETNDGRSFPA